MPSSPGTALYIGPDGGPFTVVGSANALPVTANAGTGTYNVAGPVAAGNPASGGPVYAAGFDGTNVQGVRTDTTGRIIPAPGSSAGLLLYKKQALSSTVQAIKASAGTLYSITVVNGSATVATYIQIFNVATGSVTLGATVPDWEFMVPANTAASIGSSVTLNFGPNGIPFGTAISIAATTTEDGATGSATTANACVNAFATYQ